LPTEEASQTPLSDPERPKRESCARFWCWDGKLNLMAELAGLRYCDLLRLIIKAARERVVARRPGLVIALAERRRSVSAPAAGKTPPQKSLSQSSAATSRFRLRPRPSSIGSGTIEPAPFRPLADRIAET
jgi:hypothetical protein